MKVTLGIISYNIPQQVYYLMASIRKQCAGSEYDVCIFDAGDNRPIYHKIDDAKVISNNHDIYFKADELIPMEIHNYGMEIIMDNIDSDWLVMIEGKSLVGGNVCEVPDDKYTLIHYTAHGKVGTNIIWINVKKFKEKGYKLYEKATDLQYTNIAKQMDSNEVKVINNAAHYCILNPGNSSNGWSMREWLYKYAHLWKPQYLDCIVSLTTFKGRLYDKTTYNVLLSLLNQKTMFKYKVALVLSTEEFGIGFVLPSDINYLLTKYKDKFEIIWTEKDTKPLKKLDPTMEKYPDLPIITLDDDDMCDSGLVEHMMYAHMCNPYYALGTWVEQTPNFVRWIAGVRLFPPHSLYNFPIEDYYKFYDGILDDNWNAMRCAFKMTPVAEVSGEHNHKTNQTDLKLTRDYQKTPWGEYYKRFIIAHLDEIPEELYYE